MWGCSDEPILLKNWEFTSFWLLENLSKTYFCWPVLDLHDAIQYVFNEHNTSSECLLTKWLISSLSYWYSLTLQYWLRHLFGQSIFLGNFFIYKMTRTLYSCRITVRIRVNVWRVSMCNHYYIDWILVNGDLSVRDLRDLFLWNERLQMQVPQGKWHIRKILRRLAFPFKIKAMASKQPEVCSTFDLCRTRTCVVGPKKPNASCMYLLWLGFSKETWLIKCVYIYISLFLCLSV